MKKVKLPKGIRFYKKNGVIDLSRVEIRFMVNGKNKSKLIKFEGVKKAKLMKTQLEAEVSKSDYVDPTKITLTELVNLYINQLPKDKYATKHRYTSDYRRIEKTNLSNMRIDKIKPYHISQIKTKWQSEGLGNNYITNIFAVLSASMIWAEKMSLIPHESPTRKVSSPTTTVREVTVWSQAEFNSFIAEAEESISSLDSNEYTPSFIKFFDFLQSMGCRIDEALGLTWDNYDRENKTLTYTKTVKVIPHMPFPVVEGTKRPSHQRTVDLLPRAISILDELYENRVVIDFENPYIFNIKGKPYYPYSLHRTFARLVLKHEMPQPFCLKDTRKVFITEAVNRGVPVQAIAHHVGNTPQMIWRTYARSNELSRLELLKRMSANA